jgi:hypothetical protein
MSNIKDQSYWTAQQIRVRNLHAMKDRVLRIQTNVSKDINHVETEHDLATLRLLIEDALKQEAAE